MCTFPTCAPFQRRQTPVHIRRCTSVHLHCGCGPPCVWRLQAHTHGVDRATTGAVLTKTVCGLFSVITTYMLRRQTRARSIAQWQSICVGCIRPRVQAQAMEIKKTEKTTKMNKAMEIPALGKCSFCYPKFIQCYKSSVFNLRKWKDQNCEKIRIVYTYLTLKTASNYIYI